MKEIPSGYPFLHKKQVQNNEKQLFRLLIGLNIGGAVLLGIFFLGSFLWEEKRLDSEMKVYFGKKTEFVNSYEDKYIYRAYSRQEPEEPVLFWVDRKDPWENNFIEQMMKRDTLTFWETEDRDAHFVNHEGTVYTLEQGMEAYQLEIPIYLSISCDSWEDLDACAEKISEWIDDCLEDSRYFWNYTKSNAVRASFSQFEVRIGKKAFWIDSSEIWGSIKPGLRFTEELTELMRKEYAKAFPYDPRPKALEEERAREEALKEKEAHDRVMKEWIDNYEGDYAAESILEGEDIHYRLAAADYVMGNYDYILIKSIDGGKSWKLVNETPFGDSLYGDAEITFQDESHGTIAGIYSDMEANQYKKNIYVTEDGGESFILQQKGQLR